MVVHLNNISNITQTNTRTHTHIYLLHYGFYIRLYTKLCSTEICEFVYRIPVWKNYFVRRNHCQLSFTGIDTQSSLYLKLRVKLQKDMVKIKRMHS